MEIAREYEDAGASCISVLTEPEYFLGKNEYLAAIAEEVSIPVIRKDFTVDEYQIYQAKTIGASCVPSDLRPSGCRHAAPVSGDLRQARPFRSGGGP